MTTIELLRRTGDTMSYRQSSDRRAGFLRPPVHDEPLDRLALVDLMGPAQRIVPGGDGGMPRTGRSWRPGSPASAGRWPGGRRSGRRSRPPGRRPRRRPRRRPSARGPSDPGRGACTPRASVEILGVRPNSPAITIRVDSSRPLSVRSSSRAETPGRSAAAACFQVREGVAVRVPGLVVAEVHLNQVDSASTSRRAISSDQPKEFRPYGRAARGGIGHVESPADPWVGRSETAAWPGRRSRRRCLGRGPPLAVDVVQQAQSSLGRGGAFPAASGRGLEPRSPGRPRAFLVVELVSERPRRRWGRTGRPR